MGRISVELKANVTRILDQGNPTSVIAPGQTATLDGNKSAVLAFESVPLANHYSAINSVELVIRPSGALYLKVYTLTEGFDPSEVCAENAPSRMPSPWNYAYSDGSVFAVTPLTILQSMGSSSPGVLAMKNGIWLQAMDLADTFYTSAAAASSRPSLLVDFGDDVYLTPSGFPTQGYVDRAQDLTLQWSNAITGGVAANEPYQMRAELHYHMTDGLDTQIDLSDEESYTIPANTLGSGTVEWWVRITDSTGNVERTPTYTLTTVEPLSTAKAISPTNEVVDGSNGVTFTWQHRITTGSAQTGAEIQISDDGTTWTTVASPTGAAQSYSVAQGVIGSGQHYWRVRTYNQDSAAGAWSSALTFILIAPPLAPSVIATNEARPTISWSASEQEAYEIQIDGVSRLVAFGTETTARADVYLPDGSHDVAVRVQNQYGLWSDWGVWTITVANTPGRTITLTAASAQSPELSWVQETTQGDVLTSYFPQNNTTHNGITYTWNGRTCTISGTMSSSSGSVENVIGRTAMPDGVVPGSYVYAKVRSDNTKARFRFRFYDSEGESVMSYITPNIENAVLIPENAVEWVVTIYVNTTWTAQDTATMVVDYILTAPPYDSYAVYRDDALIGVTSGMSWTDATAPAGEHVYQVRGMYAAAGNYGLSNSAPASAILDNAVIVDRASGLTTQLPYVMENDRISRSAMTANVDLVHYSGGRYPLPEIGREIDNLYSLNPTFQAINAQVEELLGREVFVRDPYGAALYGVVTAMSRELRANRVRYSIRIQETKPPEVSL